MANKQGKIFYLIACVLIAWVLFTPMSWNEGIAQLNAWWKVVVYILLSGAGTILVYWPRGSKLSDIKRSDAPHLIKDILIIALATLVIFGLVALYIGATA